MHLVLTKGESSPAASLTCSARAAASQNRRRATSLPGEKLRDNKDVKVRRARSEEGDATFSASMPGFQGHEQP